MAHFYKQLLAEVEVVGWDRVEAIDPSLTRLELNIVDQEGRKHTVQVSFNVDHPGQPPSYEAQLPAAFEVDWNGSRNRLECILRSFQSAVKTHKRLFDALDDLDAATWVLEPEHPSRADTFRKIVLGRHASLLVDLDPLHPCSLPESRFFGSESVIGPLRTRLDESFGLWDSTRLPRENLEAILQLKLPRRDDEDATEEFTLECGICYAFRLDDVGVPDVACEFDSCSRPFHRSCLFEWLRSVPDSRQSFDTLFGQCPYCSKPISVRG